MPVAVPIRKEIVLLGGGHAHLAVLKQFGMRPLPGVRLTLVSPYYEAPYSGMLPGHIAGHYTFAESHVSLLPLCQFADAQFYPDAAVSLDLENRKIHCRQRPPVAFDILSIDTGSTPSICRTPGAAEYAVPIKPVELFLQRWAAIEKELKSRPNRLARFIIVGAGAGGAELTLSLQHRLKKSFPKGQATEERFHFSLFAASSTILPTYASQARECYQRILAARKVAVYTDCRITEVFADRIHTSQNERHEYDYLLWATEASAPNWPKTAGLDVDEHGFIAVNNCLQSTSHPFVFAGGDVASMRLHPRPKSGVFAVRQGPPLARNIRAAALGEWKESKSDPNAKRAIPFVPYTPQKRFLSLISTGNRFAIASRGRWSVKGKWIWKWKDWIDRRWMRQYQILPAMHRPAPGKMRQTLSKTTNEIQASNFLSAFLPKTLRNPSRQNPQPEIRCDGCGSKVGRNILTQTLRRIDLPPQSSRSDSIGLHSPDDAAVFSIPGKSRIVQTVDFFPAFLNDPFLFGQIAALHCLSDILAMGAQPYSAQIIAVIPYANERSTKESLFQLMSGAVKTLNDHQTNLIGGHTLESERFALGMTVNGLLHGHSPWRKQGLQPGDRLILTKPLGTGMILASLMRQKSQSRWIAKTIRQMLHSNASAIPILRQHKVAGVTDCTGFGLIGHLAEMMEASSVDAILEISKIPLLEGAVECVQNKIFSSLHPQNRQQRSLIVNDAGFLSQPRYHVLFDPQTSGGLLFGIPSPKADNCRRQLRQAGWKHAQIIGRILPQTARQPQLTLRP